MVFASTLALRSRTQQHLHLLDDLQDEIDSDGFSSTCTTPTNSRPCTPAAPSVFQFHRPNHQALASMRPLQPRPAHLSASPPSAGPAMASHLTNPAPSRRRSATARPLQALAPLPSQAADLTADRHHTYPEVSSRKSSSRARIHPYAAPQHHLITATAALQIADFPLSTTVTPPLTPTDGHRFFSASTDSNFNSALLPVSSCFADDSAAVGLSTPLQSPSTHIESWLPTQQAQAFTFPSSGIDEFPAESFMFALNMCATPLPQESAGYTGLPQLLMSDQALLVELEKLGDSLPINSLLASF